MTERDEAPSVDARLAALSKRRAKPGSAKAGRVGRKSRIVSTIGAVGGGLTLVAGMTLAAQTAQATPDPMESTVHQIVVVPQWPDASASAPIAGPNFQIPAPAEAPAPAPTPAPEPVTQSSGS